RFDRRQAILNLLEGLLELGHRGAGSDQLLQFDELLLEVLGVGLDWGPRGRLLEQRQSEADAVAVTAQVSHGDLLLRRCELGADTFTGPLDPGERPLPGGRTPGSIPSAAATCGNHEGEEQAPTHENPR